MYLKPTGQYYIVLVYTIWYTIIVVLESQYCNVLHFEIWVTRTILECSIFNTVNNLTFQYCLIWLFIHSLHICVVLLNLKNNFHSPYLFKRLLLNDKTTYRDNTYIIPREEYRLFVHISDNQDTWKRGCPLSFRCMKAKWKVPRVHIFTTAILYIVE